LELGKIKSCLDQIGPWPWPASPLETLPWALSGCSHQVAFEIKLTEWRVRQAGRKIQRYRLQGCGPSNPAPSPVAFHISQRHFQALDTPRATVSEALPGPPTWEEARRPSCTDSTIQVQKKNFAYTTTPLRTSVHAVVNILKNG